MHGFVNPFSNAFELKVVFDFVLVATYPSPSRKLRIPASTQVIAYTCDSFVDAESSASLCPSGYVAISLGESVSCGIGVECDVATCCEGEHGCRLHRALIGPYYIGGGGMLESIHQRSSLSHRTARVTLLCFSTLSPSQQSWLVHVCSSPVQIV